MNIYPFFVLILISLVACQSQNTESGIVSEFAKDTANFTSILWIDSLKNVGVIEEGKKTNIAFHFKNTGQHPLVIVSAEPGCGCTVADYPKESIAQGQEGVITAAFDAKATGEFRKSMEIVTNTIGSQKHYIYFFGTIKDTTESMTVRKLDTLQLTKRIKKELKRNLLLKPIKN